MSDSRRPRLLALIVTGGPAEAGRSTRAVHAALSRVPDSVIRAFEIEALIVTDGERAGGVESSASAAPETSLPFPLTVLTNPARQGYGGSQKIGFHYAIERGFDFVVLLHGEGKYARGVPAEICWSRWRKAGRTQPTARGCSIAPKRGAECRSTSSPGTASSARSRAGCCGPG